MAIEVLQIYNDDGTPTQGSALRREAHKKGLWHKTVHVWIVNPHREILLQKRSARKESFPGQWDISAAGHVEMGSTPLAAAVREIKEELGITVLPDELRYLFTCVQQCVLNNGSFIDNELTDVYLLDKNIARNDIIVDNKEVESVQYLSFTQFEKKVRNHDRVLVPHDEEYSRLLEYLIQ
jgi:isopentenyl-diphosphate Delta-isomerase